MRKLWMIAAPAVLAAAPAAAQSTGTITVDGSVAPRCLFTSPSATIELGELALGGTDPATAGKLNAAKVNAQERTLVGWCNGSASTMSVKTEALTLTGSTGTIPPGFDRAVNYTATAVVGTVSASDSSTTADPGASKPVGLFTDDIVVTLSSAASPTGGLLVAGAYQGQVLVNLSAAIALPSASSE